MATVGPTESLAIAAFSLAVRNPDRGLRGDGRSGGGRNSAKDRRVVDETVESVTVEQSGLAIALNPEAAANGQSSRVLVPLSKPPI